MLVHSASFRLFFMRCSIQRPYDGAIYSHTGTTNSHIPAYILPSASPYPAAVVFPVLMPSLHILIDNFQLCGLRLAVHRARAHSKVRTVKWKFETSCVHQRLFFSPVNLIASTRQVNSSLAPAEAAQVLM